MEQKQLPFITPDLTELPKSIFIDLGNELLPLINLMTEFFPYYTQNDYVNTVKKLIAAISFQDDIEYRLSEFTIETIVEYFEPCNCVSQTRLSEVQQILLSVGKNIYNKISQISGYVYGVFPYVYRDMQLNSELYLVNQMHLNYAVELNHKPFSFKY